MYRRFRHFILAVGLTMALPAWAQNAGKPIQIEIDWKQPLLISKTTPTLQVVVNPLLERSSPIHDAVFNNLKKLNADYVRYVPWLPYPKLAVAELEAPTATSTSWDFSLIDPMTVDFLNATEGHSVILNFSSAPAWLFKTGAPVEYPKDPDQVYWKYTQGNELIDPSAQQLAAYYERLVNWYTNGGFTDENGKRHESGHHFPVAYWEVGNEPDIEHNTTAEQYTTRYDAVVAALKKDNPSMKFVALALAFPELHPEMFEYFLNHANHKPGIPLDMISYHFYSSPSKEQTMEDWQYTFFDQADRFVSDVRYIEQIRKRLSPETRTTLDEIGSILPTDWHPDDPHAVDPPISPDYWRLSGALYAYVYLEMVKQGIDVVGESQLVGYPSQFPSVTMLDWKTGQPNARFATLQLIKDNFRARAKVLSVKGLGHDLNAVAFENEGKKQLLLVNKRHRQLVVELPEDFWHGKIAQLDTSSEEAEPVQAEWSGKTITLDPFAVVALSNN